VKRAGDADFAEVSVSAGESVSALKESALSKLRLDVPPTAVTLTRVGAAAPLDGALSIEEALAAGSLAPRAKLLLQVHASPRTTTADEAAGAARVARLGEALRAARAEPVAGSESGAALVTLPAGVDWPQLGGAPLFVRSFYEGCFEGVLNSLDPTCTSAVRKFTIVGNAGIGKSAFGTYVLWRAVQARRTVVYVSDKVDEVYIFYGDGSAEAFDYTPDQFIARTSRIRKEKSTVLICDGVKPPVVDAFTLLITSPVRERWKEFDKLPDELRFFFPVFSRGEMGDMLRACFPRLLADAASGGEAGVWARYGKWGGIPRYVFSKLDPVSQAQLTYALNSSTLVEELVKHLGVVEIASDSAVSHRLVHLKLRGETDVDVVNPRDASWYEISRSELGSRFIAKGVFRAVQSQRSERINSLLAAVPDSLNASFAALYGSLFAQGALEALAAGGTFQLFDLMGGGVDAGKLVLPHCSTVFFGNVRALEEAAAARRGTAEMDASIFLPTSTSFTAVDAVLGRAERWSTSPSTSSTISSSTMRRAPRAPSPSRAHLAWARATRLRFTGRCPAGASRRRARRASPFASSRRPAPRARLQAAASGSTRFSCPLSCVVAAKQIR
jgi:hypothetical protein